MRRVIVTAVLLALTSATLVVPARAATSTADTAIVDAGLLTIDDFPAGWTESPHKSSGSSDIDFSKYGKRCAALQKTANAFKKRRSAHGNSPDFKQGDFDQVSNSIATFPTAAPAKATFTLFESPAFRVCIDKAFSDQFSKQAKKSGATMKVSLARLSVPSVGDDSIGYEFALTVTAKGVTARVYIDLQLVLVGRSGMTFSFEGEGTSPLLAYQSLVNASVERVRAAEAST
jgi:hypothetical protein